MNSIELLNYLDSRIAAGTASEQEWLDCLAVASRLDDPERVDALKRYCQRIEDSAGKVSVKLLRRLYKFHEEALKILAPVDFESYMLFMEWDREPKKRFYLPRRKVLRRVADALQRLADRKLRLLAVSLPPGTGKSTLALFFISWLAGRDPEHPILTGSHSETLVSGMYKEVLRILTSDEYRWAQVFPDTPIASTNAKDQRIAVGEAQRFETLQFTAIGAKNAGAYRAQQLLYCDDLVSGIEEAMSEQRLNKLWEGYRVDLAQRKQGNPEPRELHIATRWSVRDIIGRLEELFGADDDTEFIVIPALDDNEESNFDYDYGVGFSTESYHRQRDMMDEVSWKALYMNEPIEREGLLYPRESLKRFFELPSAGGREPDAVLSICDTKDRGKDYAVLPVAYQFGTDFYIVDVVCDNGLPDVVDCRLTDMLLRHRVQACQFESNSAGGRVAKEVAGEVKERGGVTSITTKYTTQNKETKIIMQSGYVKEHFYFLDDSLYKKNSDYGRFMDMLTSYTMMGRNAHDDPPDAMAMLAEFVQNLAGPRVTVMRRPF